MWLDKLLKNVQRLGIYVVVGFRTLAFGAEGLATLIHAPSKVHIF
jgi:hypothetical protein